MRHCETHRSTALVMILVVGLAFAIAPSVLAAKKSAQATAAQAMDRSDLIKDGYIDEQDLQVFSTKYLEQHMETVDWCAFYESTANAEQMYGKPPRHYLKHSRMPCFRRYSVSCTR